MGALSSLFAFATLAGVALATAGSASTVAWDGLAISVPTNGRYVYRTKSGDPFLWMADTNWELFHRLNKTDADLYLADRAAKGFTVVQAVLLSKYDVEKVPNFYGDLAIDNSDPMQPNEGYFSYVDWVVNRAANYGILIAMVPIWGRYVNCGWFGGPRLFNKTSMEFLGRYLGKRYPGIPKIMGGDTNAFWTCNLPEARSEWRNNTSLDPVSLLDPIEDTRYLWAAMLKGFGEAEAEAGYEAFVTFQPTSPYISDPPTPKAYAHNYINGTFGALSMDAVQSGHESPDLQSLEAGFTPLTPWDSTKNYEMILEMRAQFPGPVMDVENHYEGAHDAFNTSKTVWAASEVRHGLWNAVFSGACGFTYGSLPVQQAYEPRDRLARPDNVFYPAQLGLSENASWHEGLHLPGARQAAYMWRLFARLERDEFDGMSPARQFIRGEEVLGFEANRYVAGLVSAEHYWVYAGYGDAFDLDLDALAERWNGSVAKAQWFSPRHATYSDAVEGGVIALSGEMTFTPASGGTADDDWVLVLNAKR